MGNLFQDYWQRMQAVLSREEVQGQLLVELRARPTPIRNWKMAGLRATQLEEENVICWAVWTK